MNTLDIILIVGAVVYAFSGYRQGFVMGAGTTGGLLLGGLAGVKVAPMLLDRFDQTLTISVLALLVVVGCAFVGQVIGAVIGAKLRRRMTWRPLHRVDAIGGAALSVVALLLISWVLGIAASGAQLPSVNRQIRGSAVLGAVDQTLPGDADRLLTTFTDLVDTSRFPRYLEPFTSERIQDVAKPNRKVLAARGVVAARASVVKILGNASACDRGLEGTGFVYAAGRVMTNAHVVAGVSKPTVEVKGSQYNATVVYYDSDTDIAVLQVDGLTAPLLRFQRDEAASGDSAAVLGFPNNGPYVTHAARIRDRQTLRSPDIYGDSTIDRDTYSIYGLVQPGNSGGPLVDAQGAVIGVVFAASLTDSETGYVLTADQVATAAEAGLRASEPVSSGACSA